MSLDPLKRADAALKKMVEEKQRAKNEADRNAILEGVSRNLPQMMEPLLHEVAENSRFHTEQVVEAIKGIQITPPPVSVDVSTPKAEVTVSQEKIEIPEIKTDGIVSAIKDAFKGLTFPKPEVHVEAPKIPEYPKFPEFPEFPDSFSLKGVDKSKPLPVLMMGLDGKPAQFGGGATISGGKSDFFTIVDIKGSTASLIDQTEGALKVTGNFTVTGSASSTLAQLVDSDGNAYTSANPLQIAGSISTTPGGTFYASDAVGSVNVIQSITLETIQVSGAVDSVYITGAAASTFAEIMNPDGRVKVELPTGSSGLTDTELRATAVPVSQVSGASFSVVVNEIFGSTGTNVINPDNRLKVELPSGSSGLTDTELRAAHLDVQQVSGATDSVNVVSTVGLTNTELRASTLDVKQVSGSIDSVNVMNTVTVSATDLDVRDLDFATDDVSVYQVSGHRWSTEATQSGTWNITTLTGITNSLAANIVDSSGVAYSGSNPLPISDAGGTITVDGTVAVSDITASVKAALVDSTGVQYSGSNPVPITGTVTGVTNSVAVVALDRDGNPLTTGPIAQGDSATALRVVIAGNSDASVTATQSGTWNIGTVTTVTGITNSVASAIVDSSGVMYGSANPMHIAVHDSLGSTITSFGSGDSKGLAVAIVDASGNQITSFGGGTQYAEGATASTYTGTAMIFAEASSDAAKVVSSVDPLPATLATALSSSIDSILSRPISLRGNISTAYATLNSNTETTLLAASAGNYLDLVWVKFANTSSGAVTIDLRDVSAGNIVDTYEVPANGVVGISMAVPYPQGNQGNAWTVDYNDSDLSNTTVYVSGMFHKTT